MGYIEAIQKYIPYNEQEEMDQANILEYCKQFDNLLVRDNHLAHFTASSWIVNPTRDKVLMIYHKIYRSWSWTGGHVDGNPNFLEVAIKEAKEETGVEVRPISKSIGAIDILHVPPHKKRGVFVSSHVHLNITYFVEASEEDVLELNQEETKGVMWIPIKELDSYISSYDQDMLVVYHKLIQKLQEGNYGKD